MEVIETNLAAWSGSAKSSEWGKNLSWLAAILSNQVRGNLHGLVLYLATLVLLTSSVLQLPSVYLHVKQHQSLTILYHAT